MRKPREFHVPEAKGEKFVKEEDQLFQMLSIGIVRLSLGIHIVFNRVIDNLVKSSSVGVGEIEGLIPTVCLRVNGKKGIDDKSRQLFLWDFD